MIYLIYNGEIVESFVSGRLELLFVAALRYLFGFRERRAHGYWARCLRGCSASVVGLGEDIRRDTVLQGCGERDTRGDSRSFADVAGASVARSAAAGGQAAALLQPLPAAAAGTSLTHTTRTSLTPHSILLFIS